MTTIHNPSPKSKSKNVIVPPQPRIDVDERNIRKLLIPHRLRTITEWNPIVNNGLHGYVHGTYTLKTALVNIVVCLAQRVRQLEKDLFAIYVTGNHEMTKKMMKRMKEDKNND